MDAVDREQAPGPLVLALDIGTSSIRAQLYDRFGREVRGASARRSYQLRIQTGGAAEADPQALLEVAWHCLDDILQQAGRASTQIGAVAVCTFVSNILGLDSSGQVVVPLTTYADTRSAGEVAVLRAELDEEAVHQRTGCPFHPSYLPARLLWLARCYPQEVARVAHWLSLGELLELHLFGQAAVSYSVASWTGLLDRYRLAWDQQLLAVLPVTVEQLAPLTDLDAPRRGLEPCFATRWPALSRVPWFPAIGDGAAANIGSGCTSPRQVALSLGTTGALRVVFDQPIARIPAGLWCYLVDRARSLPGGALTEGGNVFAWMKKTLRLDEWADLDKTLGAMEPDVHGLTVLPFWAGERSPGWAGQARATLHGLSLATTPLDILRAGLEAVAYRIALVFDRLRPLLPANVQVIASGGALLASPAWQQIIADVLGRPVAVSSIREASSRGVALLALEALGILPDLAAIPPEIGLTVEPNPAHHARYVEAMERQRVLYDTLV